jgi:hypothetical protein
MAGGNHRPFRLLMVTALSLALGFSLAACSKCDVPTWHRDSAPQSCHDGPAG